MTRKIEDKKNLEGVKVGDRIDITYTQALIANIERATKVAECPPTTRPQGSLRSTVPKDLSVLCEFCVYRVH